MPGSFATLHPLHQVWRFLPAAQRRKWLATGSAWLAAKPDASPPESCDGILVAGEIGRASGLGESARIMHRALEAMGVASWAMQAGVGVPGESSDIPVPCISLAEVGPRAALVLHVNAPVLPAALLRLPRGLVRGRRVIGFWAWELETVPASWRPATACVHEVWAPSRFTARALETLMPGRVRVVPHALGLSPPQPARMDRAAFGLPADALVVLVSFSLASAFERKNPLAAIDAFRKAFGNRPDRILVVKVGHGAHFEADLRLLLDAIAGADNIRLETRALSLPENYALTAAADIVLSLHRSEGFGLVPAEAMMLGRAVVATDWSATAEFLDTSCGVPISYRLVPARDPRGVFEAPGAVWAEADVDQAASALVGLAGSPEKRAQLGRNAVIAAHAYFGGEALREAVQSTGYRGRRVPS